MARRGVCAGSQQSDNVRHKNSYQSQENDTVNMLAQAACVEKQQSLASQQRINLQRSVSLHPALQTAERQQLLSRLV